MGTTQPLQPLAGIESTDSTKSDVERAHLEPLLATTRGTGEHEHVAPDRGTCIRKQRGNRSAISVMAAARSNHATEYACDSIAKSEGPS